MKTKPKAREFCEECGEELYPDEREGLCRRCERETHYPDDLAFMLKQQESDDDQK